MSCGLLGHRLTRGELLADRLLEGADLPTDRGLSEVELGFTPDQARCEAARCLRCFANILLDTSKCVLCALCADVCPLDLIDLVPSEEVAPGLPSGTS